MISKRDFGNKTIELHMHFIEWVKFYQSIIAFFQTDGSKRRAPSFFFRIVITSCIFCIPCAGQAQEITLLKEYSFNHQLTPYNVFSPDGKYFVTQKPDYVGLYLREVETGEVVQIFEDRQTVMRHAFSPDGKEIVYSTVEKVVRKDVQSGQMLREYGMQQIMALCFSQDNSSFLASSSPAMQILRVDAKTGNILQTYPKEESFPFQIAFNPGDSKILCFTSTRAIILDAKTGALLNTFAEKNGIHAASFTPDFSSIGLLNFDYKVQIWRTNPLDPNNNPIQSVLTLDDGMKYHFPEVSPNQKYLIVGAWKKNAADLWDIAAGKIVQSLGHSNSVVHNVFSSDGSRLVTYCDNDKTIKLWDASKLMSSRMENWGKY